MQRLKKYATTITVDGLSLKLETQDKIRISCKYLEEKF